ncbi:hypothetical protein FQR65_LT20464 [Abscondita terminalis]|nr:hypothetical protein FQR65_LT20464 [Abscondita terminalis]
MGQELSTTNGQISCPQTLLRPCIRRYLQGPGPLPTDWLYSCGPCKHPPMRKAKLPRFPFGGWWPEYPCKPVGCDRLANYGRLRKTPYEAIQTNVVTSNCLASWTADSASRTPLAHGLTSRSITRIGPIRLDFRLQADGNGFPMRRNGIGSFAYNAAARGDFKASACLHGQYVDARQNTCQKRLSIDKLTEEKLETWTIQEGLYPKVTANCEKKRRGPDNYIYSPTDLYQQHRPTWGAIHTVLPTTGASTRRPTTSSPCWSIAPTEAGEKVTDPAMEPSPPTPNDAAHRLIQYRTMPRNKIVYTLTRPVTAVPGGYKDPTNAIKRTLSRVYNTWVSGRQLADANAKPHRFHLWTPTVIPDTATDALRGVAPTATTNPLGRFEDASCRTCDGIGAQTQIPDQRARQPSSK